MTFTECLKSILLLNMLQHTILWRSCGSMFTLPSCEANDIGSNFVRVFCNNNSQSQMSMNHLLKIKLQSRIYGSRSSEKSSPLIQNRGNKMFNRNSNLHLNSQDVLSHFHYHILYILLTLYISMVSPKAMFSIS